MDRPYINLTQQELADLLARSAGNDRVRHLIALEFRHRVAVQETVATTLHRLIPKPVDQRTSPQTAAFTSMTLQDAYTVLGVGEHTALPEIKLARQHLLQQYHPDKVASLGIRLQQVALEEAQRINLAYRLIREARTRAA